MSARSNDNLTAWLMSAPALFLIFGLAILPSVQLLLGSFVDIETGGLTLQRYWTLLESPFAVQAFWRTLRVSAATTLATIVGGYALTYLLRRARPAVATALLALTIFPLMVSTVVRAFGWQIILGRTGIINSTLIEIGLIDTPLRLIKTELAVIIGETHLLLPYMVMALLAVLQKADPRLEEAANSLGANPLVTFIRVTLPMSLSGLLSGTLLVFALAMTAFATPLLLGGERTPLLTTLLYSYAFTLYDLNSAAAVALVLVVLSVAFYMVQRAFAKRRISGHDR